MRNLHMLVFHISSFSVQRELPTWEYQSVQTWQWECQSYIRERSSTGWKRSGTSGFELWTWMEFEDWAGLKIELASSSSVYVGWVAMSSAAVAAIKNEMILFHDSHSASSPCQTWISIRESTPSQQVIKQGSIFIRFLILRKSGCFDLLFWRSSW